ncbi:MAG: hypothetical protein ACM3JI_03295, partial [Anaerolineae bacterium]
MNSAKNIMTSNFEDDKKKQSDHLTEFLVRFEREPLVEEKIRLGLQFMRACFSGASLPQFKD